MKSINSILSNEQWKEVPCYEGLYEVSDIGRVRSIDRSVEHKVGSLFLRKRKGSYVHLSKKKSGYINVGLYSRGIRKYHLVHRLVLLAFVGQPSAENEACHKNGNAGDNRLENLRWDTRCANVSDKKAHGTVPAGESHWKSRFIDEDIRRIRERALFGCSNSSSASDFGVANATIQAVLSGRSWCHVS